MISARSRDDFGARSEGFVKTRYLFACWPATHEKEAPARAMLDERRPNSAIGRALLLLLFPRLASAAGRESRSMHAAATPRRKMPMLFQDRQPLFSPPLSARRSLAGVDAGEARRL